jgi:hypothetical protein
MVITDELPLFGDMEFASMDWLSSLDTSSNDVRDWLAMDYLTELTTPFSPANVMPDGASGMSNL